MLLMFVRLHYVKSHLNRLGQAGVGHSIPEQCLFYETVEKVWSLSAAGTESWPRRAKRPVQPASPCINRFKRFLTSETD